MSNKHEQTSFARIFWGTTKGHQRKNTQPLRWKRTERAILVRSFGLFSLGHPKAHRFHLRLALKAKSAGEKCMNNANGCLIFSKKKLAKNDGVCQDALGHHVFLLEPCNLAPEQVDLSGVIF